MVSDSKKDIEKNREALLSKVKEINGKTAKDIDFKGWLETHPGSQKGALGEVVQIYLGKDPDSDPNADFPEADLELKVTGLRSLKSRKSNSFTAKERLVLTMINYTGDHGTAFEDSHLLSKCHAILLTCYQYENGASGKPGDYSDFRFVDSFIYELSGNDLEVIKNDYDTILGKINDGKAETISESDTKYLEACPKGRNKLDTTDQYGSPIKAMRRAFAFKPSFLNAIIRQRISNENYESVMDLVTTSLSQNAFEDSIKRKLSKWFGQSADSLFEHFQINKKNKGAYATLISAMVDKKNLENTEEFQKANIHIKTVRVEQNGHINEQTSLPPFDFFDVAYTPWDESDWQAYFNGAELMIPVFKNTGKEYVFSDVIFYKIPDIVTGGFARYTYEKTQKTLLSGNIVDHIAKTKTGKVRHITNFVGMKENPICHVRPHGSNFLKSQRPIPVPDKSTGSTYATQSFWIGSKFIEAIVEGKADQFIAKSLDKMQANGNDINFDL